MRLLIPLMAVGASALLVGCGSSGGGKTVAMPPTASLSAAPTTVTSGAAATLTWRSTSATSCTASGGWSGTLAASGSQSTGALTANTTYSMTCTGAGGTSGAAAATVNVKPTATLTASPTTVASGGSSTLTWSSTNSTSCTASGSWSGTLAASGSRSTGALTANASYSLTCTGAGGTSNVAAAAVTIVTGNVTVAPLIAALTPSQSQQYTATVPGGGGATWTVDGIPGGGATVGRISSAGLYTAGTVAGTHKIVATSIANTSQSGSAVAAVTDLAGVYTYHNDLARDGANEKEYALTTSNVNTASFGKLFSCTADGAIYTQPLWVANLTVNGAKHNVVFVATQHDSLYAFDAEASPCVTLWSARLIDTNHGGAAGETSVPSGTTGWLVGAGIGDLTPEVGVTGTPVIDPVTGTLYVVSKSVNAAQTAIVQRLHAIDWTTGNEKAGSPVAIAGTFPGTFGGGTTVSFSAAQENQRPGLAFANGVVYIGWSSHEDSSPWFGWVIGYSYNGSAFTQTAAFNATPNVDEGGIWMSGSAPAVDASGNLFVMTGNGTFDASNATPPKNDYGDSLLELSSTLTVSQYFTPSDQLTDYQQDLDFGAGGAMVLADLPAGSPKLHVLLCGGKSGNLYLLNRDLLGGLGDGMALQKINFAPELFATGAYWNSRFYLAGVNGPLTAFQLDPSVPKLNSSSISSHSYGFPGSTPSISAAGTQDGIVWALETNTYCTSQSGGCGPAVLYAYDAANVATELWDSAKIPADAAGNAVKFTVPTIADGRVYVGTRGNNTGGVYGSTTVSGELDIYGLKP